MRSKAELIARKTWDGLGEWLLLCEQLLVIGDTRENTMIYQCDRAISVNLETGSAAGTLVKMGVYILVFTRGTFSSSFSSLLECNSFFVGVYILFFTLCAGHMAPMRMTQSLSSSNKLFLKCTTLQKCAFFTMLCLQGKGKVEAEAAGRFAATRPDSPFKGAVLPNSSRALPLERGLSQD